MLKSIIIIFRAGKQKRLLPVLKEGAGKYEFLQ